MESLKGPASAGGENDDEDVFTIEADMAGPVRQWLEAREKGNENKGNENKATD